MKKILLTLVGITSGVSFGFSQMLPTDLPSELTTAGITGTVVSSGETVNLNGPWYRTSTFDYGSHYRGGYYTNSAGQKMNVIMQNGTTLVVGFESGQYNEYYSPTWGAGYRSEGSTWWAGLTNKLPDYGSPSMTLTLPNLSATNFANGLTAQGYAVGGVAPEGWGQQVANTSVFLTQAQELNVGLTFQNGQWTPAP
jgi:hypothetical protein